MNDEDIFIKKSMVCSQKKTKKKYTNALLWLLFLYYYVDFPVSATYLLCTWKLLE